MFRKIFILLLLIATGPDVFAQPANDNCSNALSLCPAISYSSTNQSATTEICPTCADGDTTLGAFCFDYNNTIWFSFTTNSSGGSADVTLSNISCLTGAGNDNELQGVIIDAATPCNATTYTTVSNCEPNSSGGFTLSAAGLAPNTTYYVLIDGDSTGSGITNEANCNFSIIVTGTAVEWTAQSSTTNQTCGNTDGSVTINSVSGGTSPYQYSINGGAFQSSNTFNNLVAGTYVIRATDNSGCVQTIDTVVVLLMNGPQVGSVNTTDATCNNNDGQIEILGVTGGTSPYTYTLTPGSSQSSNLFTGLGAGSYAVTVADANGCDTTLTAIITNTTGPDDVTPSYVFPDCGGGTNGELSFSVTGGTGPYFYSLNGGPSQSSNSYTNLSTGNFTLVVTDANGCTFDLNNIFLPEEPGNEVAEIALSASPNPACAGNTITYTAGVTNGGTNPQIEWFVNGASVQTGGTTFSSSSVNDGDIISATIVSDDPCVAVTTANSNEITQTVIPVNNPTVSIVTSTNTACSNETVTFTATPAGCTGSADYQWNINGSTTGSGTSPILSTTLATTSTVSVTMICTDACSTPATSNSVNVTVTEVEADAGPDQIIFEGGSAQLQGSGGGTYSWNPQSSLSNPNVASPIATPGGTTTYYLTVSSGGCTDTDEVIIYVIQPIAAPNTFTPNGDGVNDFWSIARIDQYPNCRVTVYDRWGQKVFSSIGYSDTNAWDGTFHGAKLPAATYYYVIDLNSGATGGGSDNFAGSITIVY